ncbi:hypothetical protein P154DRAFT_525433 [Amniculicola lignicola CBS 123094]|uniref:Uncharacterized protein n=1 Tax=Amniculicola lignicola CBS 123094 TaxID=1392246 RepID=A0A6A5W9C0_9PLEO|nr:hypothetical protein P154DRAFT_525433 [Amniculicola lignicola CBS 123094]
MWTGSFLFFFLSSSLLFYLLSIPRFFGIGLSLLIFSYLLFTWTRHLKGSVSVTVLV